MAEGIQVEDASSFTLRCVGMAWPSLSQPAFLSLTESEKVACPKPEQLGVFSVGRVGRGPREARSVASWLFGSRVGGGSKVEVCWLCFVPRLLGSLLVLAGLGLRLFLPADVSACLL